ncbi:iron ABC transporter substrate-binding protein [Yersinia pseudotuberculosis]|uniref:Solute-binding iron ABC transport protein n=2 Tax=Yersinia pseudotuberculosis complex TaxID=1649845 RepID=A0A380Q2P1_YERPU|nr:MULTISPECIES: siderophore ABC transporter substrate-binding protein [Yersinia pseudotuberculosis complex]PSH22656.1 iron ABC transporter substrate-binding protein [Yersinia pseudotuberculosis]CRG50887.1 solute-binding iron ABC transport protein [Yersinia wautersii]CRY72008.1 solute-binding iron ABC transport protein [Yersinia pseudotuberculosis]SUP80038.1 solute-binding iron ABC transport protein [Yersinia pseudotuberculosis]
MRLRLALFSSLLAATFAITGCDQSSATPDNAATISIEHAQGTTLVPLNPQKVVILNPSVLDNADALHIKVAGVPQTSTHLPAFLSKYSGPEYMNTGTLFEPDYEALSQAKPDLIIAGGRAQDAYNKLSAIAPTIALDVDTQHFTQSLTQRTEQLASIFGKEEEAKTLLGNFSSQVNAIKQKSANAGSAMVLMISGGKMSAYTPGSRFGFIFDELGFTSAATFAESGRHGNVVTSELILNANPDWLFVLDRDNAIGRTEGQSAQQVLDNPLIHKTKAWQNDRIVYLDSASLYIAGGVQSYTQLMDKVSAILDKPVSEQ